MTLSSPSLSMPLADRKLQQQGPASFDQDFSALSVSDLSSALQAEAASEHEDVSKTSLREQLDAAKLEIAALKSELSAQRVHISENGQATVFAAGTNRNAAPGGASSVRGLLQCSPAAAQDHSCSGGPEQKTGGIEIAVWKNLFDDVDQDHNGELTKDELEAAMKDDAQLFLSRSRKLREVMEELKLGNRTGIKLEEFAEVMKDLFTLRYEAFFKSAKVEAQLTAAAWKLITGEDNSLPALRDECSHLHAFQSFMLKTHEERVEIFAKILIAATAPLAEVMAREVVAAGEYAVQQQQVGGKFAGMQLGDALCFDCGIDVLGLPDLNFEEGISREHASDEPFDAWNNGQLRKTSAQEQLALVLPEGWAGRINNRTYGGVLMCDNFEEHPMAKAASLSKAELVMCRLYTGPMYFLYNSKLRALLPLMKKHWTGEKTASAVREAMEKGIKELGPGFVTSILVLDSALLKLRTVSQLPANRKVYRGLYGVDVPESFKGPDERGNRGGVEFGFLSTSSSKTQAVGYINFDYGMPQLYEIQVGQINRGTSLKWISYFPAEEEVLLPPLCSLEATGDAQYEDLEVADKDGGIRVRKVMVWPVQITVNLKGKTIDQHRANRKRLHAQMADNALGEVAALVMREDAADEGEEALRTTIRGQCEAVVRGYRQRRETDFNNDSTYSSAIQDVLMLPSWATGLLELKKSAVAGLQELQDLQLHQHLPSSKLLLLERHASANLFKRNSSSSLVKRNSSSSLVKRESSTGSCVSRTSSAGSSTFQGSKGQGAVASAALAVCLQRGLVRDDVEEEDAQGSTALARSSSEGKMDDVELLLLSGARVDARDKHGYTPLMRACENGHEDARTRGEKQRTAMMLIDSGANVNARSDDGLTPLFLACRAGFEAIASRLVDEGAQVHATHKCRFTPLMRAALRGLEETARMLVENEACVNASNDNGDTALILACRNGHESTANMLVEEGADVNAENRDGQTALFFACWSSLEGTARLLVERGAHGESSIRVDAEAVRQKALPSGPYYIEIQGPRQTQAAKGAALFAQNVLPADRRNCDSTWVCVHDAKFGVQSQWRLEPAGNGAYYVQLVGRRKPNAPTGASLHVYDGLRDGTPIDGSSWLCVHDDRLGANSQWRFLPVGDGSFYIELVGRRQAGAAPGASLHVWNDEREGEVTHGSTWVCVHDNKYGEGSQWRLVPVSESDGEGVGQAEGR